MTVDCVVVHYRSLADLERFLISYNENDHRKTLTVVDVDPVSLEATKDLVTRVTPKASLLQYTENIGYGRGANRGAKHGTGETIAIFNADVVLNPDTLRKCENALWSRDDWGVLGPLQKNSKGQCTHPGIFGQRHDPKWRDGWMQPITDDLRDVRDDAVTVMGSAYFMKRRTWDHIANYEPYRKSHFARVGEELSGAFPAFPFYFEETLCSYIAVELGWKVVYYGHDEITHEWHEAIRQNEMETWASQQWEISERWFGQICGDLQIPCNIPSRP